MPKFSDADAEKLYTKVAELARENPREFARKCNEVGIFYRGERTEYNTLICVGDLQTAFGFGATEEMVDALMNYGSTNNRETKDTEIAQGEKETYENLGIELCPRLCFPPNATNIPLCEVSDSSDY